jgi:hypothetical protein
MRGRLDQRCPPVDVIAVYGDNSDLGDAMVGGAETRRFDIDDGETPV